MVGMGADLVRGGQHRQRDREVEMAAYVIVDLEVTDPAGYDEYRRELAAQPWSGTGPGR